MIRKLTLAVGIGAGYVLGARAGRDRYEQIVAKARELSGQPAVQDFTSNVQATASSVADKAKDTVNEKVSAVGDKVSSGSTSTPSTGTVPPTTVPPVTSPTVVVDLGPADTGSVMPGAAPSLTNPDVLR